MKTYDDILEKLKEYFEKRNDMNFVGVFGSYAKGAATEDSDIDVLVRFSEPKGLFDIIRLEGELSEILQKKVEVVTEGALSPYIREEIFKTVKPIYGTR